MKYYHQIMNKEVTIMSNFMNEPLTPEEYAIIADCFKELGITETVDYEMDDSEEDEADYDLKIDVTNPIYNFLSCEGNNNV